MNPTDIPRLLPDLQARGGRITKKRPYKSIRPPDYPDRAVGEARTRDPQLGKLMLYQLSYYRIANANIAIFFLRTRFSREKSGSRTDLSRGRAPVIPRQRPHAPGRAAQQSEAPNCSRPHRPEKRFTKPRLIIHKDH